MTKFATENVEMIFNIMSFLTRSKKIELVSGEVT